MKVRRISLASDSLGVRLGAAFGVVLVLAAVAVGVAVVQFDHVRTAAGDIDQDELQETRLLGQMEQEIDAGADWFEAGLERGGVFPPERLGVTPIDVLVRRYSEIHTHGWPPGERELYERLEAHVDTLVALDGQALSLARAGDISGATQLHSGKSLAARSVVRNELNALAELETGIAVASLTDVVRTTDNARKTVVLLAMVTSILGIVAAFVITRSIAKPIQALADRMEHPAASDLGPGETVSPVPATGPREMRRLAASFEQMHRMLLTAIQRERAERDKSQMILDHMAEGVLVADAGGTIVRVNRVLEHLLSGDATRPGARVDAVFTRRVGDARQPLLLSLADAGTVLDLSAQGSDGSDISFAASINLSTEQPSPSSSYVVVLRDVSRIIEFERMKADFVDLVSHELSTPVTNLGLAAELHRQQSSGLAANHPSRQIAEILEHESRRARVVVEDILTSTRFAAGERPLRLAEFSLAPVIEDAVAACSLGGASARISCSVPPDETAIADPLAIRLVLHNLIDNALRYSPAAAPVEIFVIRRGAEIHIEIADHGAGIEGEHLGSIFERSSANVAREHAPHGFGLGLAVSRSIAEAMGGRLEAESTVGSGSVFRLVMMGAAPETQAAAAAAARRE